MATYYFVEIKRAGRNSGQPLISMLQNYFVMQTATRFSAGTSDTFWVSPT